MTLAEWKRVVRGLQERPPREQAVAALHSLLLQVSRGPGGRFPKDLVSDVLLRILERPGLMLTVRRPETYLRLLLRREQYVGLRRAALEAHHLARGAQEADPGAVGSDPRGPLIARLDLQRLLERAGDRLTDDDRK